jgi:glycosyltransferase involved in cell wall biosynthesis
VKILKVVHQALPRWVGGTELYVHQLARALLAAGHQVEVFTRETGRGLQQADYDGVTYHRVGVQTSGTAADFRATFGAPEIEQAFKRVLQHVQPDIIHFHHLLGLPMGLFWNAVRADLPTVITLHDYWFVCANTKLLTNDSEQLCGGPQAWINCARCGLARLEAHWALPGAPVLALPFVVRDLSLRRILHRADHLIAPSRFLRDVYIRLSAPAERLSVIETGIQLPGAPVPSRPPGTGLRVLYAGALANLKGVHILVQSFETLPHSAELWIVGDPTREPVYSQQLRQARHPGVRFLGQLGRAELWERLAEVDLVAVPSLWYENSPLIVQEARAMRRPVIASRLGALVELVRDGLDGVLAPPGDVAAWAFALQRLAAQPAELERLQANLPPARTHTQLADDMERIYAACLPSQR